MANPVPNRAHDPNRRVTVGNYAIEYGYNPHTNAPEAWAEPANNKASWFQSSASTMTPKLDGKGNETGESVVSHGTRGTNDHPIKAVRKHIEKTLPKMGKK